MGFNSRFKGLNTNFISTFNTICCGWQSHKFQFQYDIPKWYEFHNNYKLQPTRCNVSRFIYFYRRSTCFILRFCIQIY